MSLVNCQVRVPEEQLAVVRAVVRAGGGQFIEPTPPLLEPGQYVLQVEDVSTMQSNFRNELVTRVTCRVVGRDDRYRKPVLNLTDRASWYWRHVWPYGRHSVQRGDLLLGLIEHATFRGEKVTRVRRIDPGCVLPEEHPDEELRKRVRVLEAVILGDC